MIAEPIVKLFLIIKNSFYYENLFCMEIVVSAFENK